MKRLNMILIFLAICITAYAQKEPKPKTPNVDKAKTMLDKGDLQGAKAIIDDALTFDKTKDKAKTQYYAGLLYESIYYQQDSAHLATIDSMAYEKCVQAFKKVKTLENQLGAYYNFAEIRLNKMYSYIFNRAAKEYQNQEYPAAIKDFDRVRLINENDTTAITYGGYAAQQANNDDEALSHFEYLVDHNMADVNIHRSIIFILRSVKHDTIAALDAAEKARKQFPDDHDLKQDEITMMILTHKIDKAKQQLEDAITKDPGNFMYYYEMGFIYDNEDDYTNSVKYYNKALELNPDYLEANYNLGVKHYNEGAKIGKKANFMSMDEYQKHGKQVEDSAAVYFRQALPYFEKCHQLQPDDIPVIQTLSTLYGQLKMKAKQEEMTELLSKMGAEKNTGNK